jgi:hypothetical protein
MLALNVELGKIKNN